MATYRYFALHPRHLDNPNESLSHNIHSRIRIIQLLPGSSDAQLRCIIEHIELRDQSGEKQLRHAENGGVPFEALSYTWGDETATPEELTCEKTVGEIDRSWPCNCDVPRGQGVLRIRTNLAQALRSLRDGKFTRKLWIDALCIDQNYDPEKLQQIQIMGRIYGQASLVRAWLGPEGQAKLAFEHMSRYAKAGPQFDREMVLELMQPSSNPVYQALGQIFSRPYFQRRWIIQEVALAANVICHCGDRELPLDIIVQALTALSFYETMRDRTGTPLAWSNERSIIRMIPRLRDPQPDKLFSPVSVMRLFSFSECRDDRDRVLALLAYLSRLWGPPENCQLQLTGMGCATVSLKSAFTFLAQWQLKLQKQASQDTEARTAPAILELFSVACLTRPICTEGERSHLPSWVPDWRIREFEYDAYDWQDTAYRNSEADGWKCEFNANPDSYGHLNTSLHIIDTVEALIILGSLPVAKGQAPLDNGSSRHITSLETVCSFLGKQGDHSDQVCRACQIYRVRIQRRVLSVDLVTAVVHHLHRLDHTFQGPYFKTDEPRQILKYFQGPWSESDVADRKEKLMARFLKGRCIFITRKGNAGIGNLRVRPGDSLVSFTGGLPDFILRLQDQCCADTGFRVAKLISDAICPQKTNCGNARTTVCLS
jgi:hypothetical protein